jgi:hypothetical protein
MMDDMYTTLEDKAAKGVQIGVRLVAAAKSTIGLLPITMAILPGLAKGAMKVKTILPQTNLIGFVLIIVPLLQLPMMATIMAVVSNIGGTWKIWVAVYLLMIAQVLPYFIGVGALGPHRSHKAFQIAHTNNLVTIVKAICMVGALGIDVELMGDHRC